MVLTPRTYTHVFWWRPGRGGECGFCRPSSVIWLHLVTFGDGPSAKKFVADLLTRVVARPARHANTGRRLRHRRRRRGVAGAGRSRRGSAASCDPPVRQSTPAAARARTAPDAGMARPSLHAGWRDVSITATTVVDTVPLFWEFRAYPDDDFVPANRFEMWRLAGFRVTGRRLLPRPKLPVASASSRRGRGRHRPHRTRHPTVAERPGRRRPREGPLSAVPRTDRRCRARRSGRAAPRRCPGSVPRRGRSGGRRGAGRVPRRLDAGGDGLGAGGHRFPPLGLTVGRPVGHLATDWESPVGNRPC